LLNPEIDTRTKVKGFQPIKAMKMNWIDSHLLFGLSGEHKQEVLMINYAAGI
jgi:hypothetical protein